MAIVPNKAGTTPTDLKFYSANRTAANLAAVVALTPLYPGEVVRALDTGDQYMGSGLVAGAWVHRVATVV